MCSRAYHHQGNITYATTGTINGAKSRLQGCYNSVESPKIPIGVPNKTFVSAFTCWLMESFINRRQRSADQRLMPPDLVDQRQVLQRDLLGLR